MLSMKDLAPKEDQGVVFGIVQAAPNATIDQTSRFTGKVNEVFKSMPETAQTFQITDPTFGFSGMVTKTVERADAFDRADRRRGLWQGEHDPGRPGNCDDAGAVAGGSQFPVEFVINSTAEPREIYEFANQIVQKAIESKVFMFADTDLKYDQPQTEIMFDRDKVAMLGVNLAEVGADLGTLLGGNYVNRFSNSGRSYKVIPEVKRGARLNVDQLKNFYVSAANGKLVQLSTFATLKTTTEPRSLNRFQQLNSARYPGRHPPRRDAGPGAEGTRGRAADLPKGFNIDYGGSSRQLRVEGNKLMGTFVLSIILIFLVLAAQFESFRDPLIILLGSVPLALTGALLPGFLGLTTINIYSQVGLITLVGLVSKNGILIVEFANKLQESGMDKLRAVIDAAGDAVAADPDDISGDSNGVIFPWCWREARARERKQHRLCTGDRNVVGTLFTLFVVPSIYMLIARDRGRRRKPRTKTICRGKRSWSPSVLRC